MARKSKTNKAIRKVNEKLTIKGIMKKAKIRQQGAKKRFR